MSTPTPNTGSGTCANDISTQMSYDKIRNANLEKTNTLYKNLLKQYSSTYSDYLRTQQDALSNPTNPELQNKKDMLDTQTRPQLIQLNQKLIDSL